MLRERFRLHIINLNRLCDILRFVDLNRLSDHVKTKRRKKTKRLGKTLSKEWALNELGETRMEKDRPEMLRAIFLCNACHQQLQED